MLAAAPLSRHHLPRAQGSSHPPDQQLNAFTASLYAAATGPPPKQLSNPGGRPARPARSPFAIDDASPTALALARSRATSARNALIPGLGFHLSQNKRTSSTSVPADLAALASPESVYSSPETGGPPTVSDRPDPDDTEHGVAWTGEEGEWRDGDNYQSPVWASRWDRREGSESSELSLGGSEGGLVVPGSRRGSASQGGFSRALSSFSTESLDQAVAADGRRRSSASGRGDGRRPSNDSASHLAYLAPFSAGGSVRRSSSKLSLESTFGAAGGARRGSQVSIVSHDDDAHDGWDDYSDLQDIDRRGSYDSNFAFDSIKTPAPSSGPNGRSSFPSVAGRPDFNSLADNKSVRSLQDLTFGSLPYTLRKPASFQGNPSSASSVITRKRSTDLRRVSVERRASIENRGIFGMPGGQWDSRRASAVSSVDSVGERERVRHLGGLGSLNRRESEVLEVRGKGGRYGVHNEQRDLWTEQPQESRWSPSSAESSPEPQGSSHHESYSTQQANLSLTFSFEGDSSTSPVMNHLDEAHSDEAHRLCDVSSPGPSSPTLRDRSSNLHLRRGGVSIAPSAPASPPPLISAFSDDSASDSDDSADLDDAHSASEDEDEDSDRDEVQFGHVQRVITSHAQARRVPSEQSSPVQQRAADLAESHLVASPRPSSPEPDHAYLASTIRLSSSPSPPADEFRSTQPIHRTRSNEPLYTHAPAALGPARRPGLNSFNSAPVLPRTSYAHGPRHYDRMAAFQSTAPSPPLPSSPTPADTLPSPALSFVVQQLQDYPRPRPTAHRSHTFSGPPASYPPSSPESSSRAPGAPRSPKSRRMSRLSARSGNHRDAGKWDVPWGKRASISSASEGEKDREAALQLERDQTLEQGTPVQQQHQHQHRPQLSTSSSYLTRKPLPASPSPPPPLHRSPPALPFESTFNQRVQREDQEQHRQQHLPPSSRSSRSRAHAAAPPAMHSRGLSSASTVMPNSPPLKPILARHSPLLQTSVPPTSSRPMSRPNPVRSAPMVRAQSSAAVPSSTAATSGLHIRFSIDEASSGAGPSSSSSLVRGQSSSSATSQRSSSGRPSRSAVFSRLFVHKKSSSTSQMP